MKKLLLIISFLIGTVSPGQILSDSEILELRDKLSVNFFGDSQIEVGGPYAGLEFHHSSPLLQRISFYYPAANSIDNSTDYWFRDTTHIMNVTLKVNNGEYEELGHDIWEYNLTPYRVSYFKEDQNKRVEISYEFCKNSPAFVLKYKIQNITEDLATYSLTTDLTTVLKTCHTYNPVTADSFAVLTSNSSYKYSFDNIETKFAQLFILNAGEKPVGSEGKLHAAKFDYEKTLNPGESFIVEQIIGCTTIEEFESVTNYLINNYKNEVKEYESHILTESFKTSSFTTGNDKLDFTTHWAKAVVSANKHYIDNELVPMPCPAEYNFYFTHDVLVTDLAVVFYDLERVKNDLLFLAKHKSPDDVLPHAYYWKDSSYATEYSEKDSWNHLWFLILCGKYLRHSRDLQTLETLYPIINESINITLNKKQPDDLMWAARPDGWDIGTSYGPRTFMTVMAIKAFKEYVYISTTLQKNVDKLIYFDSLSNRMNEQLIAKLWSDELNYLINYYEDGSQDKHYYIGSLLASHFHFLGSEKNEKLIKSASRNLLDKNLGIYNVYPMDFHLLKDFLKFQGNEVGPPYHYANGGVWQHGNAWYALGLISTGQNDEAYSFINNIMSMDGIINSPNGQPAMYEYRISDKSNPEVYGKIDKPQFLWAGGWYLYSLYNLYGVRENNWNISLEPYLPGDSDRVQFMITLNGKLTRVDVYGKGNYAKLYLDKEILPSNVMPEDIENISEIKVIMGDLNIPAIFSAETKIFEPTYSIETKQLTFNTKSFAGNKARVEILSPLEIDKFFNEDSEITTFKIDELEDGNFLISYEFDQFENGNNIEIIFN